METTPIYLTAPLNLRADPARADAPTRFSGVAYSGATIEDWGIPFVIDLASTRIEPAMPLLHEHRREALIGTVLGIANSGTALEVSGELFADIDATAKEISIKAARGAQYQMSVGLFSARAEDVPSGSEPVTVNGNAINGPVTVLRGGLIREVSIVTLGADSATNAAFFSAGATAPTRPEDPPPMTDTTDDRLSALEAQVATLTGERDAALAQAQAAQAALDANLAAVRTSAVQALLQAIGQEYSEARAAPYLALSQEAFDAIAADLRASVKPPPPGLFEEHAVGSTDGGEPSPINLSAIYAKRRSA